MTMNDYIALITKVRAMRSQLLTKEDIQDNPSIKNTQDIYQLLLQTEGYSQTLQYLDTVDYTPDYLIPLIHNGVYQTFLKLYRFSSLRQRQVLKLYGIKYEADYIKRILTTIQSQKDTSHHFDNFTHYLEKSRGFDIAKLQSAKTIGSFIDAMNDTVYSEFFETYSSSFKEDTFDIRTLSVRFDQFVASYVWKHARHIFSDKELKPFKKFYSSYTDLVNIESIYRLKFIYELDNEQIKRYLLTPYRRLDETIIEELTQANNELRFIRILNSIGYEEAVTRSTIDGLRLKRTDFLESLLRSLTRACRESMLPIIEYLENKQYEASLLVHETEKLAWSNTTQLEGTAT